MAKTRKNFPGHKNLRRQGALERLKKQPQTDRVKAEIEALAKKLAGAAKAAT